MKQKSFRINCLSVVLLHSILDIHFYFETVVMRDYLQMYYPCLHFRCTAEQKLRAAPFEPSRGPDITELCVHLANCSALTLQTVTVNLTTSNPYAFLCGVCM